MPDDNSIKRVMNKVHNLVRREPDAEPEGTDEDIVEPGDAPVAIRSPKATQQKGSNNVINNNVVGPWLILLTGIAVAAIMLVITDRANRDKVVEAQIQAAVAQTEMRIRVEVAQDVADAKAVAHTAETHARVALDKVETAEVELGKKGINIRTDGH